MKRYIKFEKNIKFSDFETEKQKFHQHKEPISIKNIDIGKITVSNKVPSVKKGLNILLVKKMLKKSIFIYISSKKLQQIEKTLMKIILCFFDKR